MTFRKLLKILQEDGWEVQHIRGSHHYLKHPEKPGKLTVPLTRGYMKKGTVNKILKHAGLK